MPTPTSDSTSPGRSSTNVTVSPDLAAFNPWQLKPWWCQPWSILLTGISLIGSSWLVAHQWWLTLLVAAPVGVWMGFFLLLWPRLMRDMLRAEMNPSSPETD